MNRIVLILIIMGLQVTMASAQQWKLVWSDEFDNGSVPDPAKWSYEEGFVRNKEVQYYTVNRPENARIENGMLVIEGRHEPGYLPKAPATRPSANYTAASIHTHGKFEFTYGRVEARAKVPQGKGVWPAIWMLGANIDQIGWPRCGEIDIMEFVGHTPNRVYGTVHWGKSSRKEDKKASGKELPVTRPFDDFHIYAIEWHPDRIDIFYDGRKYHTVPVKQVEESMGENPFSKPQYLLINLALGGSWGGDIDDSIFPQRYLVDYIRVYQQEK